MNDRIYLDWNATAPLRPQAREAVLTALEAIGNPSSVHHEGRRARQIVETARAQVALLVGGHARHVTFTSGGTEANAMALSPAIEVAAERRPRDRLLVSAIEHASVRSGGRFDAPTIDALAVTPEGVVDLEGLAERLAETRRKGERPLVSVMLANNETGIVQPIRAVADLVHQADGLLHVDAVQAAGRVAIDIGALQADLLTVSAHKIGGPTGVGALIRRDEMLHFPMPLIAGGGQEHGRRAGTENISGIAGFGAAAAAAVAGLAADGARMAMLRNKLEAGIADISQDAMIFGTARERVPNTVLFAVPGIRAETALIALDLEGIAVSSGAACSSGKVAASHVLAAMGVEPTLAAGAVRVSIGHSTTDSDVEGFLQAWRTCVATLGKSRQGIAA